MTADVTTCGRCGAAVADQKQHNVWHLSQTRALARARRTPCKKCKGTGKHPGLHNACGRCRGSGTED